MTRDQVIAEAERLERSALGHFAWADGIQQRAEWFRAIAHAQAARAQSLRDAAQVMAS